MMAPVGDRWLFPVQGRMAVCSNWSGKSRFTQDSTGGVENPKCPEESTVRRPGLVDTVVLELLGDGAGDRIELPTRGFSIPCSTD